VLGLLGNTDTPHLHFHIMDGPSPLLSNGLSYVFTNFTVRGVVTDEVKINPPFAPQAATIPVDTAPLAGPHQTAASEPRVRRFSLRSTAPTDWQAQGGDQR